MQLVHYTCTLYPIFWSRSVALCENQMEFSCNLNMRINLSCLRYSISELWLKGRLSANNDLMSFFFFWSANPLILEMFGSVMQMWESRFFPHLHCQLSLYVLKDGCLSVQCWGLLQCQSKGVCLLCFSKTILAHFNGSLCLKWQTLNGTFCKQFCMQVSRELKSLNPTLSAPWIPAVPAIWKLVWACFQLQTWFSLVEFLPAEF